MSGIGTNGNDYLELENIVPWGRSLNEYKAMFSLTDIDLKKKILGCGDGPACFNAELTKLGGHVVSVDPIYEFDSTQIRSRIEQVYPQIMSQMLKNSGDYIWDTMTSVEELGNIRMRSMEEFLSDYDIATSSERYVNASLPILPFDKHEFDLALCSHYLFLYSSLVDQVQHFSSMMELCRVAKEVRVYPLLSLEGAESKHLQPIMDKLSSNDIEVSLQPVTYQFQKGATKMLVAKNPDSARISK
ncbi:SAM-dependent methyltransferase [Pseudomonadota bacterium]